MKPTTSSFAWRRIAPLVILGVAVYDLLSQVQTGNAGTLTVGTSFAKNSSSNARKSTDDGVSGRNNASEEITNGAVTTAENGTNAATPSKMLSVSRSHQNFFTVDSSKADLTLTGPTEENDTNASKLSVINSTVGLSVMSSRINSTMGSKQTDESHGKKATTSDGGLVLIGHKQNVSVYSSKADVKRAIAEKNTNTKKSSGIKSTVGVSVLSRRINASISTTQVEGHGTENGTNASKSSGVDHGLLLSGHSNVTMDRNEEQDVGETPSNVMNASEENTMNTSRPTSINSTIGRVSGGHWKYVEGTKPPYIFSPQVCNASYLDQGDCIKTANACPTNLMNWVYVDKDGKSYPRFDVEGFRRTMRNKRIVFVGCSLMRQQVQALIWTLGHDTVNWHVTQPNPTLGTCTTSRRCVLDTPSNITICWQFLGSMATKLYREGNYTLDHSLRGHGDSSCLLRDEMAGELAEFDAVFVQSIAWWLNLRNVLDSPTSPSAWTQNMLPMMYYDAMGALLSKISQRTKTVLVLGHTGVDCQNKSQPEPYLASNNAPQKFGWNTAPVLWNTSLNLIKERSLDVQVVDAREPLMQSVHAHPAAAGDCLHFCMTSHGPSIYLDMYWNEVFSWDA